MALKTGYWGNLFWGGSFRYGMTALGTFTGPPQKGSHRVTVRYGGTVTQLDVSLVFITGGTFQIGIQGNNSDGFPDGNWISSKTLYLDSTVPEFDNQRWVKIPINASVSQGQIIHLVVEPKTVCNAHFMGFPPNNKMQPYDLWEDPNMFCLWNNGSGWQEANMWAIRNVPSPFRDDLLSGVGPVYVLTYSNEIREGQPYHTTWDGMKVFPGSCHGERFKTLFNYPITVDKFGCLIDCAGNPPTPLTVNIYDFLTGQVIVSNLQVASPGEVPINCWGQWQEHTVNFVLEPNKLYQLLYTSSGGDASNHWIAMTQGAFGPLEENEGGHKSFDSYRMGLGFGGFNSCKLEGCVVPAQVESWFYPDDLPFYFHYGPSQTTYTLNINSDPVTNIPFTLV